MNQTTVSRQEARTDKVQGEMADALSELETDTTRQARDR